MNVMNQRFLPTCLAVVTAALVGLAGCGDDGGTAQNTSPGPDAGEVDDDGGGNDNNQTCQARTCAEVSPSCGTHDDGCGQEIDCGACTCSPATFRDDCPSRPCMKRTGCDADGGCEYEPMSCAGEICEECLDGECSPDELRRCGAADSCPAAFCDPAPREEEDGQVTYRNLCTTEAQVGCGTCGLGSYQCDGDGGFECVDPPLPGQGDLGGVCDEAFVYFDAAYSGDDGEGTRQKPFTNFDDAIDHMQIVNASVLIVAGSPTVTVAASESGREDAPYHGFEVIEGISILGGYGQAPEFVPDRTERPSFEAPESNIALEAHDIESPTVLRGLAFENSKELAGQTSYGALIRRSPGLELVDLTIIANDTESGADFSTADPMPASTTNRSPSQSELPPIDISDDESLVIQATTCDPYDVTHPEAGEFSDDPAALALSCPIFDDRARQAYGADTAEEVLGLDPMPAGGAGGAPGIEYPGEEDYPDLEIEAGQDGINPMAGGYVAKGGYWYFDQANGFYEVSKWVREPAEDGQPYFGGARYAGAGASGVVDGELDGDRLWRELGDGAYGELGYPGASGAGGAGGRTRHSDRYFTQDSDDRCMFGLPGEHGGSGGCGGLGGRGGLGGDWAIGLLLDESEQTTFDQVSLHVGDGANGQRGSAGGAPAPGAEGGPLRYYEYEYSYYSGASVTHTGLSAPGGDGAAGQWGGHGGHGAGGNSVGVLCAATELAAMAGFEITLGQPGLGAQGRDAYAPEQMSAPAAAPDGQALESLGCELDSSDSP